MERPQQSREGEAVHHPMGGHFLSDALDAEPLDPLGFGGVGGFADVGRPFGREKVEAQIAGAVVRVVGGEPRERARPPARLLQRLAGGRLLGVSPASMRPAGTSQPQVSVVKR